MCVNGLMVAPIFCDGMILQRESANVIYGKETQATRVTVNFNNQKFSAIVDEKSNFSVVIPPYPAGGPYNMTIEGSSTITINDILFGDVYILSGQSNMELPIRRVLDVSGDEIEGTYEPEVRQYLMPATYNFKEPEEFMVKSEWKKAVREDLKGFSAVGFFFAKEINRTYKIPIGLIMTAVGGCRIESWMKPSTLRQFGDFESGIEDFKDIHYFNSYVNKQQQAANDWLYQLQEQEQKYTEDEDITAWNICRVPSLVSDYTTTPFCGSIYLCKDVFLAENPVGDDAYLYMGSIVDSDCIWINDTLIGRTEYRYPPRKYRIKSGILKKGHNEILARIVIHNNNGGTIAGKPYHLYYNGKKLNLEGEWYYRIGKKVQTSIPEVLFPPNLPIAYYNTVVVPLAKTSVKGILWYQGESNTGNPNRYSDKFAAMVYDWRKLLGWEVPFLYVQLPGYTEPLNPCINSGWAFLREEQRKSLELNHIAMVSTLDIGESNDLHPQNKKTIGVRLSLAAKHVIYNENVSFSGPLPINAEKKEDNVRIEFEFLEDTVNEYSLNNFELAGVDDVFYKAIAIRKGKNVLVSCEKVKDPNAVRYAWCDDPKDVNFFNDAGLPAPCFRIDVND